MPLQRDYAMKAWLCPEKLAMSEIMATWEGVARPGRRGHIGYHGSADEVQLCRDSVSMPCRVAGLE